MISWKHSFNRLSEEYEIAKKKQQALDGLYEKGRISQSTHDSFKTDIAATIAEIEKQQQDLVAKMAMKTAELQNQIKTLEMLLANYEIQHVTGEIDENTYTQEINLFNNGLETAKHELQTIQDAMNQLCNPSSTPSPISEPAPVVEAPAPIPENVEVPAACPPAEVTPSYVVSAPEPVITSVVEAAATPILEMPNPEPVTETPVTIAEAPIAAPEPIPDAVVEAPVVIEQPTVIPDAPILATESAPVIVAETPVVIEQHAPVIEAPVAETTTTPEPAPIIEASIVETTVVEQPVAVIAAAAEVPVVEITAVEAPVVVETPAQTPAVIEEMPSAVEPVAVIEEPKMEKAPLDEFEVSEPDVVQKELMQAVEEIAENPLSQAPQEAHEEAAKATEAYAETQPTTLLAAKETLPEASSSNENKE